MNNLKKDEQQVFDWYKSQYSTELRLERSLEHVLELAREGTAAIYNETRPRSADEASEAEKIIAKESLQYVETFLEKVFKKQ